MTEVTDARRGWARRAEAGGEDPAAMTGRAGRNSTGPGKSQVWGSSGSPGSVRCVTNVRDTSARGQRPRNRGRLAAEQRKKSRTGSW